MDMIKNVLKGIVIGLANIIPGVSGGTMMVSMGIYDKLIHCITHLFKEFKKSILFLLPIAIGMVIAVAASAFVITDLFELFPLQTTLCFVGLIVGGLPAMWKNVKGNRIKPGHGIAFLLFFVAVVILALIGEKEGVSADLSFNLVNVLKLFGVGVIAAATMVIPGVSGSMMLLLLGYYNPILSTVKEFIKTFIKVFKTHDIDGLIAGLGILIPFGIGVVIGIFAVAKLIEIILAKFPLYAYWAIIGLIVASPIAIIAMGNFASIGILTIVGGIVALAAGFIVAMKLGE